MALAETIAPGSTARIFNHDIMSCTAPGVTGNHLYSGRALGLTEIEDFIQLHPSLQEHWDSICSHYHRIGLSHSEHPIWDVSRRVMQEYSEFPESVFFFGKKEHESRPHGAFQQTVEHINSKNNFTALASHLRLNVPKTRCFPGKQWFAGIQYFSYPCYLKAAVSVSGRGIFRCETPDEIVKSLSFFQEDVPLQVQDEIKSNIFLNIQYRATDEGLERHQITEQVLDGFVHQGNRFPASYEPWDSVQPMAEWLYEKGLREVFAFDVAVIHDGDTPEFVLVECNPRYNGASYPSGVARKLEIPQWISIEAKTRYRALHEIDLNGIEYDPKTRSGVILINWGTIQIGKLGVLIAGDPAEQERLAGLLKARL